MILYDTLIFELTYDTTLSIIRVKSTGEDLALLSLCDHIIITHGTFSSWAALLSPGDQSLMLVLDQ